MTKDVLLQNDMPATRGMLLAVKDEILARMDERFLKMEARFEGVDMRFLGLEAQIADIKASVHHANFLAAEQRNQNVIALDAIRIALDELTGVKDRLGKVERHVGLA